LGHVPWRGWKHIHHREDDNGRGELSSMIGPTNPLVSSKQLLIFDTCVPLDRLESFSLMSTACMHMVKNSSRTPQSEEKKASEKELLDFLNKAPIAMHWLSGTGHVLWANETEMNVLGYTPEEYIGQVILDSLPFLLPSTLFSSPIRNEGSIYIEQGLRLLLHAKKKKNKQDTEERQNNRICLEPLRNAYQHRSMCVIETRMK
jgi:hypothetical protein